MSGSADGAEMLRCNIAKVEALQAEVNKDIVQCTINRDIPSGADTDFAHPFRPQVLTKALPATALF